MTEQERGNYLHIKSTLSALFASHQNQFMVLGVVFFVLFFLSNLPYFNLLLTKTAVLFIVWILAVFLLKLSGRFSIKVALVLLCFCSLLLILKRENWAEEIGNLVYGLLLIGVIQEFIVYLREEKSEKKA